MRCIGRFLGGKSFVVLTLCMMVLIVLPSCSLFQSSIKIPTTATQKAVEEPKPEVPEGPYCEVNLDYPISEVYNPTLYVYKSERRMILVQNKTLIRDYHIALGPSPSGDKYFRGDGRTPEGEFFICAKNASSKYYKSLGLNYPTSNHPERRRHE